MKKIILVTLQIVVTVSALLWVFHKPETRAGLLRAVHEASVPWLLAALAASVVAPLTASVRWWLLLRVADPAARLGKVVQLVMVGMLFNLMLPGSTGGDAVKFFYTLRGSAPARRARIILSVVMDRLLGLLALILLAAVFLVLRYDWLTHTRETANIVDAFAVLLFMAGGGISLLFVAVQLRLVDRLPAKMPGRTKFIELASAVQTYTRAWPTTLTGVLLSFVGHLSMFTTFYFVSNALRAGVSLVDMTVIMPIVNTFAALPISMSGAGVRETLIITLMGKLCGVPPGLAATVSIIGFLCTVVFNGLVGGVFYLFFRSSQGAVPPHVDDVEEREQEAALPEIIAEGKQPAV